MRTRKDGETCQDNIKMNDVIVGGHTCTQCHYYQNFNDDIDGVNCKYVPKEDSIQDAPRTGDNGLSEDADEYLAKKEAEFFEKKGETFHKHEGKSYTRKDIGDMIKRDEALSKHSLLTIVMFDVIKESIREIVDMDLKEGIYSLGLLHGKVCELQEHLGDIK